MRQTAVVKLNVWRHVSKCALTHAQRRMKDTQHCFQQSRINRALHNSVERDCQHHEFQCECSSGVLQATSHIVGLIPSVPGYELTGCQAPSIRTDYLKQSFSIVLECFVTQSVVHNLTEFHHRSDSRDRFRVQRIQHRDTCFRFLEEITMVQLFCIICVMLLVLCFELFQHVPDC